MHFEVFLRYGDSLLNSFFELPLLLGSPNRNKLFSIRRFTKTSTPTRGHQTTSTSRRPAFSKTTHKQCPGRETCSISPNWLLRCPRRRKTQVIFPHRRLTPALGVRFLFLRRNLKIATRWRLRIRRSLRVHHRRRLRSQNLRKVAPCCRFRLLRRELKVSTCSDFRFIEKVPY